MILSLFVDLGIGITCGYYAASKPMISELLGMLLIGEMIQHFKYRYIFFTDFLFEFIALLLCLLFEEE